MPAPRPDLNAPSIDNSYAIRLKALHVPGHPIIFANIYDPASTNALLSLNRRSSSSSSSSSPAPLVHAVATASYAIAASLGIADEELTLAQNVTAISGISALVRAARLPLSVDLQDGYGAQLESCVWQAVRAGAVGANVEDSFPERGFAYARALDEALRPVEAQCDRIRALLRVAGEEGVPDFVVNARTDVFRLVRQGGAGAEAEAGWDERRRELLDEAVARGKSYLEAGATCVFVWGGSGRGVSRAEVEVLVRELGGRVAVKLADGEDGLSVRELAEIGVCRISVGPSLWVEAMKAVTSGAERILRGGQLWSK